MLEPGLYITNETETNRCATTTKVTTNPFFRPLRQKMQVLQEPAGPAPAGATLMAILTSPLIPFDAIVHYQVKRPRG